MTRYNTPELCAMRLKECEEILRTPFLLSREVLGKFDPHLYVVHRCPFCLAIMSARLVEPNGTPPASGHPCPETCKREIASKIHANIHALGLQRSAELDDDFRGSGLPGTPSLRDVSPEEIKAEIKRMRDFNEPAAFLAVRLRDLSNTPLTKEAQA